MFGIRNRIRSLFVGADAGGAPCDESATAGVAAKLLIAAANLDAVVESHVEDAAAELEAAGHPAAAARLRANFRHMSEGRDQGKAGALAGPPSPTQALTDLPAAESETPPQQPPKRRGRPRSNPNS